MHDILIKGMGKGPAVRNRVTLVETMVIVEAANGEVVVLVSCPACFSILGVTRRADLAIS